MTERDRTQGPWGTWMPPRWHWAIQERKRQTRKGLQARTQTNKQEQIETLEHCLAQAKARKDVTTLENCLFRLSRLRGPRLTRREAQLQAQKLADR